MWGALLGGGATLLGGAALVPQAIDAYRWFKPDPSDLKQQILDSPLDAAGNPILSRDLRDALWRAGVEFPEGVGEWAKKTRRAARKRDYFEDPGTQRANQLEDDRIKENKRRWNIEQQNAALERTNQMIEREALRNDRAIERKQYWLDRADQLRLQKSQFEDKLALERLDLLDRQGRQDWQQQQFEKQLTLDEEQRVRDQRKFYALLGQSILSEGVKAFF